MPIQWFSVQLRQFWQRRRWGHRLLAVLLTVLLLWPTPALAQPLPPTLHLAQLFKPPKRGAPKQTTGGGRRDAGQCRQTLTDLQTRRDQPTLDQVLVALIPPNNWGLTLQPRPSFLFYVPQTPARTAEFVLDQETGDRVFTTKVALPNPPAIVQLPLPETVPALAVNTDYFWAFSLVCGEQGDLVDPLVSGRVRRIDPDPAVTEKLATATPLAQVELLAAEGVWFDAVNQLAALQQTGANPAAVRRAWQTLLQSVELGAIAQAPLKPATPTP